MGRGGSRPGAGRKPSVKSGGGNVVDFPNAAGASTSEAIAAPPALAEPPEDLVAALASAENAADALTSPDAARVCKTLTARLNAWRRYAPLAIDQGTLTPSTVPGFRELCEQLALKEELAAKMARFGIDGKSGRDRLKDYARIAQRVDASLARFKLTAFGKPDDDAGGAAKRTPMNPWAQAR